MHDGSRKYGHIHDLQIMDLGYWVGDQNKFSTNFITAQIAIALGSFFSPHMLLCKFDSWY